MKSTSDPLCARDRSRDRRESADRANVLRVSLMRTIPVEHVLERGRRENLKRMLRGRDLERPFRVPLSPVLPAIAALACFYLMRNLDLLSWLRFAVWLVIGLVIYLAYGRRHSLLNEDR